LYGQRQTILTSNLNSSHTEAELWGYNRKGLILVQFYSVKWAFFSEGLNKVTCICFTSQIEAVELS